ncbi:hypothetical protein [Priestia flexa]|uniref:hypothetical protein n=1 Tax=Priestia flexa TaxID=86664 RepID=UPI001CFD4477|nr:hypothetical protein [Priestia flexa]
MKVLETDFRLAMDLEARIFEGLLSAHRTMFEGEFDQFDKHINEVMKAKNRLQQLCIKKQSRDRLEALVKELQSKGMVIDFVKRVI